MVSKLLRSLALLVYSCATASAIQVPVYFEPNQGQVDSSVQFVARTPGHSLFLNGNGAVLNAKGNVSVRMRLSGVQPDIGGEGLGIVPAKSNYFIGTEAGKWRTSIPQYEKVRYRNAYPGIDVVYYANGQNLEYDFVIAPGANPKAIDLVYEGAQLQLADNGDLLVKSAAEEIRQHRPSVYQDIQGKRVEIGGGYRLTRNGHVQFAIGRYDQARPLVIDPVIQFSLYVGGAGYDAAFAVAVDNAGGSYITGNTNSITLPAQGSAQEFAGGGGDAFVAKFSGEQLVYITYIGGRQNDAGTGIAVDALHNVYITGFTTSLDFPIQNAAQVNFGGGEEDAFITKISPAGDRILYSTYLGGGANDYGNDIAVDGTGAAYTTGWTRSSDFPTRNAFQSGPSGGGEDVFVTKLSPGGNGYVYSTFVGGNGRDYGIGIAVDATGAAYVTGSTNSAIFPTVNALQGKIAGASDAFLFKLVPAGNALVFCSYFGGTADDTGFRVALDGTGVYVAGYTSSSNLPVLNAAQPRTGGGWDAFVSKFSLSGTAMLYSTYLGGTADDFAYGLALDAGGSAYVTGWTASTNFPVQNAVQTTYAGGASDAFMTRVSPAGTSFPFSTFVGGAGDDEGHGVALDSGGSVFVAGRTSSAALPGARNRYTEGTGKFDAFLTRMTTDVGSAILASVNPAGLSFSGLDPAPQTVLLTGGPAFGVTATANGSWLSVMPGAGTSFTVTVNRAGLGQGTYTGSLTISVPGAANSPIAVPVSYTPAPSNTISVLPENVVNAASYRSGPVAPGEIITIFGTGFGPSVLTAGSFDASGVLASVAGGTRVLFDGVAAPVLYALSGQVSAIVPYAVNGHSSLQMQVEFQGVRSAPVVLAVTAAAPGLFTADASGRSQAVAMNLDGSLNSAVRPVDRGSVVVLYATGEGQTSPASIDGKPSDAVVLAKPLLPVTARVNGLPADVIYAGAAPGLVAGVMQVNVRVPDTAPVGAAVPVVVTVGGTNSRLDVTIAVQ